MVTYIKQYGIQRSCTNFVKLLLENNLEKSIVLSNVLGWKHGPHKKEVNWNGDDWDPQNKKIETIFNGQIQPGKREFQWNANKASSGIYLIHSLINGESSYEKIMLIK